MKIQKDTFLIEVDSALNSTINVKGINGKNIVVDTDYNNSLHRTRIGRINACPIAITSQYINDVKLSEKDVVVFHHFVTDKHHKTSFDKNIFRSEYFHLYAKIENEELIPLEDIIFVEPILESNIKNGFVMKPHVESARQQGFVFAASKAAQSKGILPGDKVFFTEHADYKMKVLGKDLYRMRLRNIVAVERDGELICLSHKVLAKEIKQPKMLGGFAAVRENSQLTGNVIAVGSEVEGLKKGDAISYYNASTGSITWNGETYSFLELRHINYILPMKPIKDRVIIKQSSAQDRIGDFILSDTSKEKPKKGTVVAIGPQTAQCKVGDEVFYSEFAGGAIKVNGEELIVLKEDDIYTII